jgi:protein-S-isoprenylcysteine O-methyltransferase Ste14
VILPFTVLVIVPVWIARGSGVRLALRGSGSGLLIQAIWIAALGLGFLLFAASLSRFAREGKGTLAPWDPPRRLVITGPYRFVRNPMLSGVMFMLVGEACVLLSRPHAVWALMFCATTLLYIPVFEEPALEARFGPSYREYARHVPRFIPRGRPWKPDSGEKSFVQREV